MVKREGRRLWRRVLILALFLLVPALLYDLPLFSKTGQGAAPAAEAASGGGRPALLPVEAGRLGIGPGRRHWHASDRGGDIDDDQSDAQDGLLHNLVYLTRDEEAGDGNAPLSDGGDGFRFGGDGGGSGGGAPTGFGGPGYNPASEFLPLSITPDGGNANKGGKDGAPPFFAPTSIAAVPEPATWALFILGFGFIGAQLRRARDARLVPALTRSSKRRLG